MTAPPARVGRAVDLQHTAEAGEQLHCVECVRLLSEVYGPRGHETLMDIARTYGVPHTTIARL